MPIAQRAQRAPEGALYEPCVILRPEMVRIHETARVDSFTKIEGGMGVDIGPGVHVASFCHLNIGGGALVVGKYVAITSHVCIVTGSNTELGRAMNSLAPAEWQHVQRGQTIIEDYAFIGCRAVLLPGVRIGHSAVIGAGAVVTKDVLPDAVYMGVPARFVRWRRTRHTDEQLEREHESLSLLDLPQ